MVEIREETSEHGTDRQSTSSGTAGSSPAPAGLPAMINCMSTRRVDSALFILRLVTVIFSFFYVFPFIMNQYSAYQKALLAGAATYALRLHQRLGVFQFSREFFARLFAEDACHYLFYCLIFMSSYPVTMSLMPIVLYAALHWASFAITLLNVGGYSGNRLWNMLSNFVNAYSQTLLLLIASCEIFLFPMVGIMLFSGKANLLLPFIYYRFLTLRYISRRNPNTRLAFSQIRESLDAATLRPACPAVIRNVVQKAVALVSRMAPQVPA